MRKHPPLEERFRSRVSISDSGCWLWTGATHRGYGDLRRGKGYVAAHRLAWELEYGPIPVGLNVLHHCDTPRCVRPDHLFIGTHADNVADRHAKGRDAKGERHGGHTHPERLPRGDDHWTHRRPEERTRGERVGGARLTEDQVREMRRLRSEGWILKRLAERYGVRLATVHFVVTRVTWKHVD